MAATAEAQGPAAPYAPGTDGIYNYGGYGPPPGPAAFQTNFSTPFSGNYWFGANGSERGVGWKNPYITVGGFTPVHNDRWDGWWYTDIRAHLSDEGNFFGNFGVGRRMYLNQFNTVVGTSVWYDLDLDRPEVFGHTLHQVGLSFELLGDRWDYRFNGYIPVGSSDFTFDPECFVDNRILVGPYVDSALQGFDTSIGGLVPRMEAWATRAYLGMYYYRSNVVDRAIGVSGRLEVSPLPRIQCQLQLNHDDAFKTTGILSVQYQLAGARRLYAQERLLLEPTQRNDHVVRFYQEPVFARNPDNNNALWNVVHVDSSAAPGGDGTVERPFQSLAQAQAQSDPFDIILVREGTGAAYGPIALQDNQKLFGDGVAHTIQTQIGLHTLCTDTDGILPTIANPGGDAVTLANNNEVAGFNINNSLNAIVGTGSVNGIIRDNVIGRNAALQGITDDAISLNAATGAWTIDNNNIQFAGDNAVSLIDLDGSVTFTNNAFQNASGAGVLIDNIFGTVVADFTGNTITNNAAGVQLVAANAGTVQTVNIGDSAVAGLQQISNNATDGVQGNVSNGAELNLSVINNSAINNNQRGVAVTATDTGTIAFVDIEDNLAIDGNSIAGAFGTATNEAAMSFNVLNNNSISSNGTGVIVTAGDLGTVVNTNISNNTTISTNVADGIRLTAVEGAQHNIVIGDNLAISNNGTGAGGGVGIILQTDGDLNPLSSATLTQMTANIFGNTINRNIGDATVNAAQVYGVFNDRSKVDITLFNNNLNRGGVGTQDAVRFDTNLQFTGIAGDESTFLVQRNTINNAAEDGLTFNVAADSRVSATVSQNVITQTVQDGFQIDTLGTSVFQLVATDNTLTNGTNNGVEINTNNTSRLIATFNGTAPNRNIISSNANESGMQVTSNNSSVIVLNVLNTTLSNNNQQGIEMFVNTNSQLFSFIRSNTIQNNGAANDFLAQINAGAAAPAQLCLVLTNNTTTSLPNGFQLTNNGGAGVPFNLEPATGNSGIIATAGAGTFVNVAAGACTVAAAPFTAFP